MAFDLEGAFLFANRAALTLYGFERSNDIRRNVHDLDALFDLFDLEGEPLPADLYPTVRVLRGETFTDYEVWVQKRGESRRWLGSYGGTQVEDSITIGTLLVRDVTERRELEARTRRPSPLIPPP